MDESTLKSALMRQIRDDLPGFVAQRHEDVRTSGIPDISLDGRARGSWWECKYGTPDFQSSGIQELTMLRLAAASYARYIIWEERDGRKRTMIVHPRHIGERDLHGFAEAWCVGFNQRFVVDQMGKVHGL